MVRSGGLLDGRLAFEDAHDVALLHDQVLSAVDLHLGARPFAEKDNVTSLEVDRDQFSGFIAATGTDGDDFALHRLLLRGVRDNDAALGLGIFFNPLDANAVVVGTEFHVWAPFLGCAPGY